MTEYQALQDEIARAISDCDDDETAALADVVMPVVERELSRRDRENLHLRELLNEETEELSIEVYDQHAKHQAAIAELSARDAVIEQIRALAEAFYRDSEIAGQSVGDARAAVRSARCASDIERILSALPSTEERGR